MGKTTGFGYAITVTCRGVFNNESGSCALAGALYTGIYVGVSLTSGVELGCSSAMRETYILVRHPNTNSG